MDAVRVLSGTWLAVVLVGCTGDKINPRPRTDPPKTATPLPAEPPLSPPPPAPEPAKPDPNAPFVHVPVDRTSDPVDGCTQVGGNYFSCRIAYEETSDPIIKRYLLRIARGYAAGIDSYRGRGTPMSDDETLAHAEMPAMCDLSKPCDYTDGSAEFNKPTNCLARAFDERLRHHPKEAKAAHALACKCNGKKPAFIGYNASAEICDENGQPAFIAPNLPADEGADIVACARCDAAEGPGACKREIARLQETDDEVARYIAQHRIPRCQTPDKTPDTPP